MVLRPWSMVQFFFCSLVWAEGAALIEALDKPMRGCDKQAPADANGHVLHKINQNASISLKFFGPVETRTQIVVIRQELSHVTCN